MSIASAFREAISPPGGLTPYVPNEGSPLTITELTGQKRQVVLRGRALPFRGPQFALSQRSKVTYYTGNPNGTQQLFGPTFDNTTFTGVWRDKYLQPDPTTGDAPVRVQGFAQPNTTEALIGIMNELILAGSDLEVQWSMFKRFGILKRFTPTPDRIEDVPWSLEFEWHSDGTEAPEQSPLVSLDPNKVESAMSQISDLAASIPDAVAAFEARIFSLIDNLQTQVDEFLTSCRVLANAITLPNRVTQAVRSSAIAIAFTAGQLISETVENGYTAAMLDDGVANIFTMEGFKRDMAGLAAALRESVISASMSLEARKEPDPLKIVIMDETGSLRALAQREYGNADAWQTIADANGFDSSSVPPGTEVLIPPAPGLTGVT